MDGPDDTLGYGRPPVARYYGKFAGLVADNGPPSMGAHRGEVVVKIPGLLEETADGGASQPIQVRAAPAFLPGFFYVPENGDKVWVEFVNGDINFPIWTGVWYPQNGAPQTSGDTAPSQDQKIIRTKSGLVIMLDDSSGGEKIVVKHGKSNATITLDATGVTINSDNGVVLACGQTSLTVAHDQIKLSAGATLTVKAGGVDVS